MALQASGNPISFSQIETEFGQNTDRKLGTYRVSQTVGGLTNQPIDTGIPQGTNPISFGNFYSKKLNVVIDYYSGEEETYAMPARDKYNLEANQGTYTVIGGFRTRPVDSSGTKTRIHVNKRIGGMETLPETDDHLYCSLRTGTGWEAGTDLRVEVGSSGQLWGAGGRGGDGGKTSSINGESGKGGSSALGIQYSGTTVINDGVISQGHGGGGGGGCNKESSNIAPGGAGGGGAGYPHGLGGLSDGPTTTNTSTWSNVYWTTGSGGFDFSYAGTWITSGAGTPVPSSDATFVVRDYNTGNYNLTTPAFQRNYNEVKYYANEIPAKQYEYYLNGSLVRTIGLSSWETAWKKYEVGDYVESSFYDGGEILRYKIKYSERTLNNEHKFYVNGTLVGQNTTGSVLTSGSNRYTMGSLVGSQLQLDFNAYRTYKIKKEIRISDSGTNSSTNTSAGGQGFAGAFVDGGNGEGGKTTTGVYGGGGGGGGGNGVYDGANGEGGEGGATGGGNATAGGDGTATAGGTGGTADSGGETGTGGGGGTSGAAIRRTSGITVNITNNATINGPTDVTGVSV